MPYYSILGCYTILKLQSEVILYQPVSPSSDPLPPSTNRYCLLLNQYHHISTSTAPYWPSTTKYQSIPTYTDPVSSYINQCRLPLTQYRQVPTSTTPYWPGTTKYQPFPTYTVVAWGLQTPAQFSPGLVTCCQLGTLGSKKSANGTLSLCMQEVNKVWTSDAKFGFQTPSLKVLGL